MSKIKLLLLGGLKYLIPVIKRAQVLGHHVITCDYLPTNPAHSYSDEYHNISILDKDAVLRLAKQEKINGIMSFAVDPGVYTAAYVAENMGLASPGPLSSIRILQNKHLFRQFLKENDFKVPFTDTFTDTNDAIRAIQQNSLPIMVKPVDSAGSKGVSKVENKNQIKHAVDHAMEHSFSNRIIIEEFIQNKGYASDSDCLSVNGELVYISYSNQRFDPNSPNPFTPCGFSWPSTMPSSVQNKLSDELQRLITLLDMRSTLYNIETRIGMDNEPYIMEVSPRGGGNRISEVLQFATGTDLIGLSIQAALGYELPQINQPVFNGYWGKITLHSNRSGCFKSIKIDDLVRPYIHEMDLWIKPNQKIKEFTGANDTIGSIVIKCPSREILETIISEQNRFINIQIVN